VSVVLKKRVGLVLEGGGMRGLYSAGVLDYFLQKNLSVDGVIGVSAGAVHGCSFVAKQAKRSYRIYTTYANDKRFLSFSSLWKTGDIFGADFCYRQIPNELDPFDYKAFRGASTEFYVVCTDLSTGKATYVRIDDMETQMDFLRASGSLPLVSRVVTIGEHEYLDGGIADSIPLVQFQNMGFEKNIVVLTQARDYRKKNDILMPLIRWKYRKYPLFIKAAESRADHYNETLDLIHQMEKEGRIFVIQPGHEVQIGRLEKNVNKLKALYDQGFNDAKSRFEQMKYYLEKQNS
jgi:predicted patatin/cPLA2 family phospholipase